LDYSNLLIKPADIVVPGDTFSLTQTLPVPNPAGIEGVFANQNGSRKVDDTIYVYPDAAAASQALDASVTAIPELSVKATPEPADVDSGGHRGRFTCLSHAPKRSGGTGVHVHVDYACGDEAAVNCDCDDAQDRAPHRPLPCAAGCGLCAGVVALSPETGNLRRFHDRHNAERKAAEQCRQDGESQVTTRLLCGRQLLSHKCLSLKFAG
jgi:hypothetical protein